MGLAQAFISCPAEGVVIEGRCRLCVGVLKPLDSRGLLIIGCHSPAHPPRSRNWGGHLKGLLDNKAGVVTPHEFTSDTSCLSFFPKNKNNILTNSVQSRFAGITNNHCEVAMNSRQISCRKLHLRLFVYVYLLSRMVVLFSSSIASKKIFGLFLRPLPLATELLTWPICPNWWNIYTTKKKSFAIYLHMDPKTTSWELKPFRNIWVFPSLVVSITIFFFFFYIFRFWLVLGVMETQLTGLWHAEPSRAEPSPAIGWGDCSLTSNIFPPLSWKPRRPLPAASRSAETPLWLGPSRPASRRPSSGKVTHLLSVSEYYSTANAATYTAFPFFEMFVLIRRCYLCEPTN